MVKRFNFWMNSNNLLDSDKKNDRRDILMRHFRGHDTVISCFHIEGFYRMYIRLLPENFYMR